MKYVSAMEDESVMVTKVPRSIAVNDVFHLSQGFKVLEIQEDSITFCELLNENSVITLPWEYIEAHMTILTITGKSTIIHPLEKSGFIHSLENQYVVLGVKDSKIPSISELSEKLFKMTKTSDEEFVKVDERKEAIIRTLQESLPDNSIKYHLGKVLEITNSSIQLAHLVETEEGSSVEETSIGIDSIVSVTCNGKVYKLASNSNKGYKLNIEFGERPFDDNEF